jgi:hypothetical protein
MTRWADGGARMAVCAQAGRNRQRHFGQTAGRDRAVVDLRPGRVSAATFAVTVKVFVSPTARVLIRQVMVLASRMRSRGTEVTVRAGFSWSVTVTLWATSGPRLASVTV